MSKKRQNWVMPNSNYDMDSNPAYFAIRQSAIEFHTLLRSRAEYHGRNDPALEIKHFDLALAEVLALLCKRNRHALDLARSIIGEIALVVGGLCLSPLVTALLGWSNSGRPFAISSTVWLVAIIGVLLIAFKFILNLKA